ncbi:S-layer homology domain-containing protein [uncultured Flavonifractor sp.]|uniref:S-layer homology domain-containing protein n=1 Tax=uncultured Flavonifractor sp. TaxID=1193534 RepID=UPI0026032493|nr:S-layer homology domain-containing protein [uncultured Flavonifractor sp.]
MRKRICSGLLALLLVLSAAPLSAQAAFADAQGHWAQEVVDKAADYGLIQGYPDGTFGMGDWITRSQFVTVLCRMFGWETVSPQSPSYIDCAPSAWYYSAVETARLHNVMNPSGAFRPEDYISRGEMAVMLVRALGYDTLAQDLTDLTLPFDDVTQDVGYIAIAYDIGMIKGVDGPDGSLKFLPTHSARREEAAAMLVRVYERYISKTDWLHGFYAFSSYAQINLAAGMDAVSLGWARLEYGESGPVLNSTSANGNEWVRPTDVTPAISYFESQQLPYNLNVYASAADSLTLADGTTTSTVGAAVSTPEARAQTVAALTAAAADYAGLTIDFEGLSGDAIKSNYVAFMGELRAALPAEKSLYVCVQSDTWYTGYDYRGLGAVCDKVILMAHDYQWTSVPDSYVGTANTNSPVTPFASVYEALRDLTDPDTGVEDVGKLALAISFGTAGFHVDEEGRLLETTIYHPSVATLTARLSQPDTVVTYSDRYRNPCALYTNEDGEWYKVWYENEQSVLDKLQLARLFGVTGVSLWRMGSIPASPGYDVWSAVQSTR